MHGRAERRGIGPTQRTTAARWLGCLALTAVALSSGCMARVDDDTGVGGDSISKDEQALGTPHLRASKYVRLWSNLPKARSSAHYVACANQHFKLTLNFRNQGSAVWRDVSGRGTSAGSDVFLRTVSNTPDVLTGKVHYSVNDDQNDYVRFDRAAGECAVNPGCRRTRFVEHGMDAVAPSTPGKIVKSRWQMRDYSKAWKTSQAFGPKVTVKIQIADCPTYCGCTATCADGSSTELPTSFAFDSATCRSLAGMYCAGAGLLRANYQTCDVDGAPIEPSVGSPGDADSDDPSPDNGWWLQPDDGGAGGSGGSSPGSGGSSASAGAGGDDGWYVDPDPGVGEQSDEPGAAPDSFDGAEGGVIPAEDAGCAVASANSDRTLAELAGMLLTVVAVRRRHRRSC